MDNSAFRFLFVVVLLILMLGSTGLLLGWPWKTRAPATSYRTGGWYYRHFGGGHGGWAGRGFGWGSFGEYGGDGFRGGGPGFGK